VSFTAVDANAKRSGYGYGYGYGYPCRRRLRTSRRQRPDRRTM